MPDVTPSGPISEMLDALRTLIASLSWFQTWTGHAGDAAAAAKHVLIGEAGRRVVGLARESGVVTITCDEPHGLSIADELTLQDVDPDFDGAYAVASVPDNLTLTYAHAGDDVDAEAPQMGFVLQTHRPFVVLMESENETLRESSAGLGAVVVGGAVELLIEGLISAAYAHDGRNARMEMLNDFGGLQQAFRAAGNEDFHSFGIVAPPALIQRAAQSDAALAFERWQALVRLQWGLQEG